MLDISQRHANCHCHCQFSALRHGWGRCLGPLEGSEEEGGVAGAPSFLSWQPLWPYFAIAFRSTILHAQRSLAAVWRPVEVSISVGTERDDEGAQTQGAARVKQIRGHQILHRSWASTSLSTSRSPRQPGEHTRTKCVPILSSVVKMAPTISNISPGL